MAKIMCCPFFEGEIKKGREKIAVGVKCKGGTIKFPDKYARRKFIYPLCGSLDGFEACPIYDFLKDSCK